MPSQHALGSIQPEVLTLPSMRTATEHNTCMVKRLTPADMIGGDLLDRFDSLTGLVGIQIDEINGKSVDDTEAIVRKLRGNKDQIRAALDMVDEIVEMSLMDPVVYRPVDDAGNFVPAGERNETTIPRAYKHVRSPIWTDQVSPDDKNAIVEFAMSGVRALEPFRNKTSARVDPVSTKPKVRKPPQRTPRGK